MAKMLRTCLLSAKLASNFTPAAGNRNGPHHQPLLLTGAAGIKDAVCTTFLDNNGVKRLVGYVVPKEANVPK